MPTREEISGSCGSIISNWKVIEKTDRKSGHNYIYNCECINCGAERPIVSGHFKTTKCHKCDIGRVKNNPLIILKSKTKRSENGCLEFTGHKNRDGYGMIGFNGRMVRAHRFSWEKENGPIPDGLKVLHKCDNPSCVDPNHLFLGTDGDNCKDKVSKNRQAKGETHPKAILSEKEVLLILDMITKGHSHKKIAEKFNISRSAIDHIRSGRTWKHLFK